jgi:hypothetical protein
VYSGPWIFLVADEHDFASAIVYLDFIENYQGQDFADTGTESSRGNVFAP